MTEWHTPNGVVLKMEMVICYKRGTPLAESSPFSFLFSFFTLFDAFWAWLLSILHIIFWLTSILLGVGGQRKELDGSLPKKYLTAFCGFCLSLVLSTFLVRHWAVVKQRRVRSPVFNSRIICTSALVFFSLKDSKLCLGHWACHSPLDISIKLSDLHSSVHWIYPVLSVRFSWWSDLDNLLQLLSRSLIAAHTESPRMNHYHLRRSITVLRGWCDSRLELDSTAVMGTRNEMMTQIWFLR